MILSLFIVLLPEYCGLFRNLYEERQQSEKQLKTVIMLYSDKFKEHNLFIYKK